MEINLENPIFLIYVGINGMSHQRAEEQISRISQLFKLDNVTTWIMPYEGGNRIDLIWQGSKYSSNPGIVGTGGDFIKTLGEIVDIVSNTQSDEIIRGKIRTLLIDKLMDEK
jgi:hypothetical protein